MLVTSPSFKNRILSLDRQVLGKLAIEYVNANIDKSIASSSPNAGRTAKLSQVYNAVKETPYKWASLDGTWVLDGSWKLPSDDLTQEVGWWGNTLSGPDGSFTSPYPELVVTFFPRPILSLGVSGDSARGEFPVDFTITLYSASDDVLYTENVVGNTLLHWEKITPIITSVTKMKLEVKRWSHPGRVPKIAEFFTTIQETYLEDDIIGFTIIEEREVSEGSLPIGNIASKQIEIDLRNENGKFDADNTESPLYGLLKANRRILAWLGLPGENPGDPVEWLPMGVYWSGDWDVPDNQINVSLIGRDKLMLLQKSTYANSPLFINATLYDITEAVLQDYGLTNAEYWIDPELQQFVIPYAGFHPTSYKAVLRQIAEACLGQVYVDRYGVIRVEGPSYLSTYKNQVQKVLTRDDYTKQSRPIRWGQIANIVEAETRPLVPGAETSVYTTNAPLQLVEGEPLNLTVYYNYEMVFEPRVVFTGPGTVTATTFYSWGVALTITPTGTGTGTLEIFGKPLEVKNRERIVVKDDASILDNGELRYKVPENPLIQTTAVAQTLVNAILQSFKDPRRDISLEWRGDFSVELGDKISVPDTTGDTSTEFYVISQRIEWDGALQMTTLGRRV